MRRTSATSTPPPLPDAFLDRMRRLLGEEFAPFLASFDAPATAGLRINPAKLSADEAATRLPWALTPVPWCADGFLLDPDARAGRHPFHAAGLYYLQDPSAMAPAAALGVEPGMRVLDLAASPGGKSTQLAAALRGEGVLVANEVVAARVKALGENLERWGATNVVITNDEPARLAERIGGWFDRVLLDAPCSGEGMFRKTPAARSEWSPAHVLGSAERQQRILTDAARLVRPGGRLVYSTCTFAPEENEAVIAAFLAAHPGWSLAPIPAAPGFAPGWPEWAGGDPALTQAVRLWPHRVAGEGHFLALLQAPGDASAPAGASALPGEPPSGAALAAWRAFAAETLATQIDEARIRQQGDRLFLAPEIAPPLAGVRVVRPGLWLGEVRPGRFEPDHALAMALPASAAAHTLAADEPAEAEAYLRGEPLRAAGEPGWLLVTHLGVPLGWAKRSGEIAKNHYPKGLRRPG